MGLRIETWLIMKVKEELDEWPEQQERRRSWYSIDEAVKLCKWDWMKDALCTLKEEELAAAKSLR